jgi:signal peptidase I
MIANAKLHNPGLYLQDDSLKTPTPVLNELWEQLLLRHGVSWGKVISNSMHPMIHKGYKVLVERCPLEEVRFGDIAVFRRGSQLVIHRILGRRKSSGEVYFYEKGDAVLQSSIILSRDVIGIVSVIRNSNYSLKTRTGVGRQAQLLFACLSYTSLRLWILLEYCLTLGRHIRYNRLCMAAYIRFFSLIRRILMLPLRYKGWRKPCP